MLRDGRETFHAPQNFRLCERRRGSLSALAFRQTILNQLAFKQHQIFRDRVTPGMALADMLVDEQIAFARIVDGF